MPSRTYRTDPAALLEEGRGIVSASREAKYQHRVEMVNLVLSGLAPSFLGEHSGDSKNAITGWVRTADERGFEALMAARQTGRPRRLSEAQLEELRGLVAGGGWDGPALSAHVLDRYGVELSARQCQRVLRELGA